MISNVVVFHRSGITHSAPVQWNPWMEREEVNGESLDEIRESADWLEEFREGLDKS